MRFMMIMKGEEGAAMPSEALMHAIDGYTRRMMEAGVVLEVGGLMPTASGAQLTVGGGKITSTDGPFSEAKEVIGGFAIIHAASREEAIEHGRSFLQLHVDVLGPEYRAAMEIRRMVDGPEDMACPGL